MTGDAPEPAEQTTLVCPECGGDVCETRSTKRNWTHRSRMIPRLVWIILVGALFGYWIYNGMWKFSSRSSGYISHSRTQDVSNLNPSGQLHDGANFYISRQDLQRITEGDERAMESVRDWLGRTIDHEDPSGFNQNIEDVRFGFKEAYGISSESNQYWAMGSVLFFDTTNLLSDIRDTDSITKNKHVTQFQTRFSLFPIIRYGWTKSGGSPSYQFTFNILILLGFLAVVIISARVIARISTRLGFKYFASRWIQSGIACLLLMLIALIVVINNDEYTSLRGTAYNDIAVSDHFTIDELSEISSNDERLRVWSGEMLSIVPEAESRDLLIGQIWRRLPREKTIGVKYDTLTVGFSGCNFFAWARSTYADDVQDADLRDDPPRNHLESLFKFGSLSINWGPKRSTHGIAIWPMNLLGMIVLLSIPWLLLHRISRFVLSRVQKRRVLRNQCIFCSYPLSAQAVNARCPRETT